jgi:hypothetical protein
LASAALASAPSQAFPIRPRKLPRVAKLRLGIKDAKGTAKEHPRETDHFVLDVADSVAPDAADEIRKRFHDLYGERPQVLTNVRMISPDRELAFSSAYEWWRAGKMFCHGDGVNSLRRVDGEWQEWAPRNPCANAGCGDFGSKKCSLMSRLRFMLPDVTVSGFFQVDTGSIYSAANVRNGLNLIAALTTQMFGEAAIHRVPLILSRAPQKIEFEGKLNEHFILHLAPQNYTLEGLKQLAASEANAPKMLVAGSSVPDEEDDLPEEIVPETEHEETEAETDEQTERIEKAFAMLGYNVGTRTATRAQFPKPSALIEELERRWLELPKADRDKRKASAA